MEPICITVRFDVHRLSPNQRLHPAVRRQVARQAGWAALAAYREAGSPMIEPGKRARVTITLKRARKIDSDNALACCKACIDAIFNRATYGEGVTWNDSPSCLEFAPVVQETGGMWRGREEVEFMVETCE